MNKGREGQKKRRAFLMGEKARKIRWEFIIWKGL